MSKHAIKIDKNTFAILQYFNLNNTNATHAKIGFIKPGLECLEYVHLTNWKPVFKGSSKLINDWLKSIYTENATVIKNRILSMTEPK